MRAVRSGHEIGRGVGAIDNTRPPRFDPTPTPPPPNPQELEQAKQFARSSLCGTITDLYDPYSPGSITRQELLDSVASDAGEAFLGISPTFVADVADQLLAAQGIYGDLGPNAVRLYLRACPPVP